jgi:DNA invertase Pin-like site-specific DNA recombinase
MSRLSNTTRKENTFGTPEQKGKVTVYPAVSVEMLRTARGGKIKTAAYVRVSTDSVQQEGSLILQKEYYEEYIKNNPEYEFVEIYEDDGVSATSVEGRKGFLRMIEDCKAGKIDLILTKSISRFARNTGDLLHHINLLNSLKPPVEVHFDLERTSTNEKWGEMLITNLGILAQWESQIKSKSITWAIDNLFAQGKFYVPAIYGYTKENGRDKPLVINENEAKVVRLCYAMAISGYSLVKITETLKTLDIKGRSWTTSGMLSLLSNEKYAGNLWARKTVTPNYKTHKSKKNEGEKPKYFVEEHHEPIVPPLAHEVTLKILKNKRGNMDGIPYLKAVPKGILQGFVVVNKTVQNYTLSDYSKASLSVCEKENEEKNTIFADKASIFDLRNFETVSALLFDEKTKPSCSIKDGKITFNAACRKSFKAEKAEILFHPTKAILAIRSSKQTKKNQNEAITKPIHLSAFVPIALEAAELKQGYRYKIYGTKRTRNGENIMLFDLRDAQIISDKQRTCILPNKYVNHYGNEYYDNLTACNLHKVDVEGLWEALQESRPADSLAGQIVELTEFCQTNLAEFGLLEKT